MKSVRCGNWRKAVFCAAFASISLFWASCATEADRGGRFSMLKGAYPPKPKDFPVEIFENAPPARPYDEIARLDVHLERAFFATPSLKDTFPELIYQARRAGADAIINLRERRSTLNETKTLHVTATGIKYKDTP